MCGISIKFLATFGLVLGAFCIGRQSNAEERDRKSSAPAKASSATTPAAQEKPLAVLKSGPEHTRLVYHLKAAPAYDVNSTVSQLLRQEGELHGSAGTAANSGPAMRVAIVPDVVSNCLVISGPPDAVEEVRLLVEKMDQPPPMVQFEMEMGEVPVGDAKHGEALTSEGGAPPAERPNAFRILERPKTMKTTARARVLALDNQPAFVHLGQRVPRVTGVSNNAIADTTQSVTTANVGLILGVTPRINVKEGTIVLQVDAEESQLGPENEGVPLSAAGGKVVRSPRIDAVTVQTTVMIPDGKTIILGSIARQGKTDKELVVILTPHIIPPEGGKKTGAAEQAPDSKRETGASTLDLSKSSNHNPGIYKAFCGRQVIDGVPFEIGGPVRLYGQTPASRGYPNPSADKGIRIGRKFTDLYLIHNLNWADVEGQVIAYVCLNYADGTEYIFPIRYGVHVRPDFNLPSFERETVADPDTTICWRRTPVMFKAPVRLFESRLVNPLPEKVVETMDLVSARNLAGYNLFAATVVDHRLADAPKLKRNRRSVDTSKLTGDRHFDAKVVIRVVDDATDKPIAGALVQPSMIVLDEGVVGSPFYTSSAGKGSIPYPSQDTTQIWAQVTKDGYQSQARGWNSPVPDTFTFRLKPIEVESP